MADIKPNINSFSYMFMTPLEYVIAKSKDKVANEVVEKVTEGLKSSRSVFDQAMFKN